MRVNFAVLDRGEPVDSERIVNEFGPAITTAIHSSVDRHLEFGEDPPEFLRPIWNDYLAFHMARPAAERQKMMHQSHNAYVAPDERRFVTPDVIKRFCIVGEPAKCWSRFANWNTRACASDVQFPAGARISDGAGLRQEYYSEAVGRWLEGLRF